MCSIELTEEWAAAPGNPDVNLPTSVLEDGDGMLVAEFLSHRLVSFDAAGLTARVVGDVGEGPGEYIGLAGLARLTTGGVIVASRHRLTVLSPDLEFVSSSAPHVPIVEQNALSVDDSTLVIAWPNREAGYLFHVLDIAGRARSAFGALDGDGAVVNLGRGSGRSIWSVPWGDPSARQFRLERWDVDRGVRLQVIERAPAWFTEWEPSEYTEADGPRRRPEPVGPGIIDVHEDDDGVLWVITQISDPAYEDDPDRLSWSRFTDSILEALDPSTGEVIAARRFDERLNGFSNEGRLIVYAEDAQGIPSLSVAVPVLRRAAARSRE